MATRPSSVVTGGAQGVGRAVAERLAADGEVVVVDTATDLGGTHERVRLVGGDARDPEVAARAAALAESAGPLTGWVANAAVFRDASLASAPAAEVLALVTANLALALTSCSVAVRHFLAHGRTGSGPTPSRWARSPPTGSRSSGPRTPRSTRSSPPSTRWGGSARRPRSPTSWRSCCPRPRPSSAAPSSPSTAAGRSSAPTPRRADPVAGA